ncbi:MAG TPA: hypothetical protein VGO62_20400, partial [Myxococcota bacterium]
MPSFSRAVLVVTVVSGALTMGSAACTTAAPIDKGALQKATAARGFITGAPTGLGDPEVLNRRDFVYALAFGNDDTVAFVHHVTTSMELTATQIEPVRPRFQQPVNASEFDLEDVVIIDRGPGKGSIAVPSRQGIARAFDGKTGAALHDYIAGIALIRAALSPDGATLAFGASDGRVFLVDAGTYALRGQARVHEGEVHGLAYLADGRLLSVGFDGKLVISNVVPAPDAGVHIAALPTKSGDRVFLAHLDGARAISTVRDTRQISAVVTSAAVKRLELKPIEDGTLLPISTSDGPTTAQGVELGSVHVATLDLGSMRAAVCDACVPPGVELVLGQAAAERALFVDDIAHDEMVVKPTDKEGHATVVPGAVTLAPAKSVVLPGPGTDVDVSKTGAVLVSFSESKAERSFDLYDAEKKGVYPEPSPKSGAALVDVEHGVLLKSFVGHHGFTTTAALSPDGRTVVTGGWDKRVLV